VLHILYAMYAGKHSLLNTEHPLLSAPDTVPATIKALFKTMNALFTKKNENKLVQCLC